MTQNTDKWFMSYMMYGSLNTDCSPDYCCTITTEHPIKKILKWNNKDNQRCILLNYKKLGPNEVDDSDIHRFDF